MGFNVSMSMGYQLENKDSLKQIAAEILNKSTAQSDICSKIIEQTTSANKELTDIYTQPQLSIMKASTQISLNNSLKETIKYLRTHAKEKRIKQPVFGELWAICASTNDNSEENPYRDELYDFQIDNDVKNIFAAA